MKLRIVTGIAELGETLKATLDGASLVVEHQTTDVTRFELRYRIDLAPTSLGTLLAYLHPFTPVVQPREALSDGFDVELYLGDKKPLESWGIQVFSSDTAAAATIRGPLLEMGLTDSGTDETEQETNQLDYDKAPLFVRQLLRWQLLRQGIALEEKKVRSLGSTLGVRFARQDKRPATGRPFCTGWFSEPCDEVPRPLLELNDAQLRIGSVSLPVREPGLPLVPPAGLFEHYCLEQRTAETLMHVAESVALREPCLLEGETSVSKTSIIQYLAMLLGQPLLRLNLNGQTDTGELIGRFLPHDAAGELPMDPALLQASADLLEPESQMILARAAAEDRMLNAVEIQQIMANERMHTHPWRWRDGLIVSAMRNGWWVVLDELNLAEPQILERLNPVLEREPSLVLTEHDNSVFGPGGMPVHPDFRIFATMNPAEYAGRSPLSPAYRDRWRGYRFVEAPTEADHHAMLSFLVNGQQPEVWLRGRPYVGDSQQPAYGALAGMAHMNGFLVALARFQAALEAAVRDPSAPTSGAALGVRRQERYVFTRRGLLAVMDSLVAATAAGVPSEEAMRIALVRYYLGRVAVPADRATVSRLLDAAGIGAETWSIAR